MRKPFRVQDTVAHHSSNARQGRVTYKDTWDEAREVAFEWYFNDASRQGRYYIEYQDDPHTQWRTIEEI